MSETNNMAEEEGFEAVKIEYMFYPISTVTVLKKSFSDRFLIPLLSHTQTIKLLLNVINLISHVTAYGR